MSISIWELIIYLVVSLLVAAPLWRIFKRAGMHPALSLIVFLPAGLLISGIVLSFLRWPALEKPSRADNQVGV